jgi:hypothetical protein
MQRLMTTSSPAARAFSAAALCARPSCIQIAFAPRPIAASTISGMNSTRRKMSTRSIGPGIEARSG